MNSDIQILPVRTRRQEYLFVHFPFGLYRNNGCWVPGLLMDEYDIFNPKKNPAYEFCMSERFLAYRNGRLAGRVAAIINTKANEKWSEKVVRFGWLDFIEDADVLEALMKAVEDWGKEHGCTHSKGPWGFTDMDKEGLLIEGFENLSPYTTIYNYPYYDTMLQQAGYAKDVDWFQLIVPSDIEEPALFGYADEICKKNNLHIAKAKNTAELVRKYGKALFETYNKAFVNLDEFVPLTDRQVDSLIKSYEPILDTRFTAIVLDANEQPVAFGICMPSIGKAVRKSRGRLLPFGLMRIMHALKHNNTLEALIIGVHPEYRNSGAILVIFKYIYDNAKAFGIKNIILNPQLESNTKVRSLFLRFSKQQYMKRRAYIKEI